MGTNIKSLDQTRWIGEKWDLSAPSFKFFSSNNLESYVVQRGEDMRIDLVMKSIYDDIYNFSDIDVIFYINGIDNPLNIREGMVIYYPSQESFDEYRYYESERLSGSKSIKQTLGILNKTTRVDEKRKKFLDSNYSLPPVVLQDAKPAVIMDAENIKIGGL
jgi:hypothetical protein